METIVALATPAGNSGVAIIRISGDNSLDILHKIIREDADLEPRKMYLKKVFVKDFVDQSLVVYFRAPFSFTGEDVVEIHSHGGYFLAQSIIEEVLSFGARLADHGEFSKRAFINGKISLDQAEGIIDLINAESDLQAKTSSDLMNGELKNLISSYQDEITDILAEIEAKLDYPEYDYSLEESESVKDRLSSLKSNLDNLISDSKNGLLIHNGVKVAIVGAPNVGKSSLLNALTKSNKAIVTNIAGTTRDVIEAEYTYKNIIFRLYDTAGIHESDDVVEKIGIDRAYQALENADIVLKVSTPDNICELSVDLPSIEVFNKSDLTIDTSDDKYIYVSALNNQNIDKLKQLIFDKTIVGDIKSDKIYLTNTRHIDCVRLASESLSRVIEIFDMTTFDIISSEIKSAWSYLGEVSGIVSDEAIIDKIFSKFCLGK
ncbi:MAG: tRNA uridine-5-carboxymethylaminomethyl(34) synthesis GTPase MnmE [Clostridia bacterium]